MITRRWQDWVNVVIGVWLFASPWFLGYADTVAAWNAYVMGAGIVVFAAFAAYMPKMWEEIVNTLAGIWLVVSPFVLGFGAMRPVALHTVVIGLLVITFAVWAMLRDRTFFERWHSRHSV